MSTAILSHSELGIQLCPPYDEYVSQSVIRLGQYCKAELDTWLPYLPKDGFALDIGANFGSHTLGMARAVGRGGRVVAFEPQWALFAMLCGSAALNDLRQIRAQWLALGRETGVVRVPPIRYDMPGNFGGLELGTPGAGEAVPRLTLDSFKFEDLDFAKIDVEGMELDVLAGAEETIARCRPVLCVEADRDAQVPALIAWLREQNYRLWWHRPLLGPLWPNVVSVNLMALPAERTDLPDPIGATEPVAA